MYSPRMPKAEEAKAAGAEFVGAEELVPKIQNEGWLDFRRSSSYTGHDGRCWTSGTCTWTEGINAEPEGWYRNDGRNQGRQAISKLVRLSIRLDKTNIIHVPIGKASFTEEQLADNFQTLIEAINKAKPAAREGPVPEKRNYRSDNGPGR